MLLQKLLPVDIIKNQVRWLQMVSDKRKAFLINFAYFAVIIVLAVLVIGGLLPMATPFVIGFFVAYILQRPVRFLKRKLPLPNKLVALLTVLLFYATVGVVISLLGVRIISVGIGIISNLPHIYEVHILPVLIAILMAMEELFLEMDASIVAIMNDIGTEFIKLVGQMVSSVSAKALAVLYGASSALPGMFIELVLLVISSVFITMDWDVLTGFCMRQMNDKTKEIFIQIKEYVVGTLWVCIRSYALIMSITFAELSILLTLIGVNHSVAVAFFTACFDILPVLGTGGIMIPWALLTILQGNIVMGVKLFAVYVIVTVVRNILEPKIVGSQLGLHPVVTLCSMFIGVQLFGVIGLFGFPIGLSLLRYLNDHGVINILK